MLPPGAQLSQPQIAIVGNLCNCKRRTIETTRDDPARVAAALAQDQIAQRITFPAGHMLKDLVRCEVLPTRRSVEFDPGAHSCRSIAAILRERCTRNYEDQEKNWFQFHRWASIATKRPKGHKTSCFYF